MRKRRARERAVSGERRAADRFPIDRDVKFKLFDGKSLARSGQGKTVNMSSTGILFATDAPLPIGKRIELSVDWPAKLNDTCRIKLVASGRIVRVDGNHAVITLDRHEFRTQGAAGLQAS
jgi:hypothetical protein